MQRVSRKSFPKVGSSFCREESYAMQKGISDEFRRNMPERRGFTLYTELLL